MAASASASASASLLLSLRPPPLSRQSHLPSAGQLLLLRRRRRPRPGRRFSSSPAPRFAAQHHVPDFQSADGLARDLLARAESLIYTLADAAVSSPDAAAEGSKQSGDWLSGITTYLETVLKVLKDGLSALHVPYAYGFAIILLTVLVKAATFPLTKKQVESALAMRSLQPQVKAIQQRYAGDQERIQLETARLYKLAGVNPLAGCLPTLATIPVWIGLYRALSNVADEGLLTEGFFWIPSLAGPTTIAARQNGSGISWLFPFKDGHPPLGWSDTFAYLVLPILLVISQYISAQIMQPSQGNDPSQKNAQAITKFLPLLIGYFALSVPSGLSLYWLTNNILSTAQQVWLQKLGGANNPVKEYIERVSSDETSNIEKSRLNIPKAIPKPEPEKPISSQRTTSDGSRRGERFKQIKEQEARRRKQREEEKKRAEQVVEDSRAVVEQQHSNVITTQNKDTQDQDQDQVSSQMSTSNNGGLSHSADSMTANSKNQNGNAYKEESEVNASTDKQASCNARDLRDSETERNEA
ncbi:ALBINO3-like protein 1, chloroplastic [Ananas comosus]|uniref:ALBINO3-like protein 1, chloroplastic n=1 Tax=Ananas comosus TaxID=4615 RepID=A0A6P5FWZ8_ANACO|nr:ALBINO3-like protein 1, chloroplastic [Ananas comosus]